MGLVSRLGGAILAKTGEDYFLVGDLKEPLVFEEFGFVTPEVLSGKETPFIKLQCQNNRNVSLPASECLAMALEGEELARKLVKSFMIFRNGSISERLWRLVTETSKTGKDGMITAHWLGETPDEVWDAVRDSVLRC